MYRKAVRSQKNKVPVVSLVQRNGDARSFVVDIPFGQWIYVIYSMCVARKGVSANQISKELGITYKSAWFLCHCVRYAMMQDPLKSKLTGMVEIDETYVGGKRKGLFRDYDDRGRSYKTKAPVVSLIQRDGDARSFVVDMQKDKKPDLKEVLSAFLQVKPEPEKETKKALSKRGSTLKTKKKPA